MITQTPTQRANTLYALDVMWARVKDYQVTSGLSFWATPCSTTACFGGHVAMDPYFQAQGVSPALGSGAPIMTDPDMGACSISQHLFGDPSLFGPRGACDADPGPPASDHEVVRQRLQWLLANSGVADTVG